MKGLAPGTIQGRLSALAFYGKINGHKDFSMDYRTKKMLEGWSKERGGVKDSRAPISLSLLVRICEQWVLLCRDEYEKALFNSLIAFFSALRISELVAG